MSYGIEACALALLRAENDVAIPISRLRQALLRELGPTTDAVSPLYERLRKRPDLFLLLEPRTTLLSTDEWPEEIRQEYRAALRAAGLEPEPRITPRQPGSPASDEMGLAPILRQLHSSLIDLWQATDDDELRDQIAHAFTQTDLIRIACGELDPPGTGHPTTPPRDPRRGG